MSPESASATPANKAPFVHLHLHTEFSLLDGMCRIPQLMARVRELGMDAVAITDHGVLYGAIDFYVAARDVGIKPIIGCEVYVAAGDRRSRSPGDKGYYHLTLLAKNERGYRNLIHLVTRANVEGFYYKPKVDRELLAEYREGLVCLSGCAHGEVSRLIVSGDMDGARGTALWYRRNFEDYYLEIMRNPIPEMEQINNGLVALSKDLGIPLAATSDVHYINREDASAQEILLCIQTNTTIYDDKRMKMVGDFFYLKSPQEMAELFSDLPEAVENTRHIADMCQIEMQFDRPHLPKVDLPPDKDSDTYLAELCWQGLKERYAASCPEAEERLKHELEVIRKTKFADYFLVVWDIIRFAQHAHILYGVRGSAASSIVLHCLGLTEIDPLEHRLVFERFLNVERKEMPDIDLDFQDDRREEVIAYVTRKYGQDHVAQIITFGTLGAKGVLRDVGRALGLPYADVDRVARLIPTAVGMTLDRAMQENQELAQIYQQDATVKNLIDSAKKLEGLSRHASTHAAGVVISAKALTEYVPLARVSKGDQATMTTQFTMENVARAGLLKMDILGLINLTMLAKTVETIRQTRGVTIALNDIPLDDEPSYRLLASGETSGIFQLEGSGMRRWIRELKPTRFGDVAAIIALYRPGPMEHIPTFIRAKEGLEKVHYPHPALEDILKDTYGVIVYQDQVLFIVRAFAGYSLGQADIFRKAMGKKIPEVMKKEHANFIAGAQKNGYPIDLAEQIFALIEPFAGYAFNRAHSVSYALIAYQTAYFKANFPAEYMTALLVTHTGDDEKVRVAVGECRRLGIPVLPPDVNRSESNYSIEKIEDKLAVRFGLASVKNVGESAIEPILAVRSKEGQFKSIEDLCRRVDLKGVSRRVLESLVKAGAFDAFGTRQGLLQGMERLIALAQHHQKLRETGQTTMFDLFGESTPTPMHGVELPQVADSPAEKMAWEKELLGVYLSDDPFALVAGSASRPANATLCGQIDAEMAGQNVVVAGILTVAQPRITREKKTFMSATLEDLDGSIEITAWPEVYQNTKELWEEGGLLLVEGKVKVREDRTTIICERASRYQPGAQEENNTGVVAEVNAAPQHEKNERHVKNGKNNHVKRTLVIRMAQTQAEDTDLACLYRIFDLLKDYPGRDKVHLVVDGDGNLTQMELTQVTADACPELVRSLVGMVGEGCVQVLENPA